jgi:hypothetical protein
MNMATGDTRGRNHPDHHTDRIAELTAECDFLDHKAKCLDIERKAQDRWITEGQAREQQLRKAAKAVMEVGMGSDFEALNNALALPTDTTALDAACKKAQIEVLREMVSMWSVLRKVNGHDLDIIRTQELQLKIDELERELK